MPADGFVCLIDGFERSRHMVVIVGYPQQHAPCFSVAILFGNDAQFFGMDAVALRGVEFFTHDSHPSVTKAPEIA
jgi:hypothetical protein